MTDEACEAANECWRKTDRWRCECLQMVSLGRRNRSAGGRNGSAAGTRTKKKKKRAREINIMADDVKSHWTTFGGYNPPAGEGVLVNPTPILIQGGGGRMILFNTLATSPTPQYTLRTKVSHIRYVSLCAAPCRPRSRSLPSLPPQEPVPPLPCRPRAPFPVRLIPTPSPAVDWPPSATLILYRSS